ncbi:protein phosphatase 2C domain-containing protein [Ditylenchus destructor]|uniref:Protein phosphatase 2C domain-containing protein n=1 Tax=Ditylenchus destructor TaxID=166010 RepID=A0AAD4QUY5_9BILA|nr:protein phosphatase 2C domain-containing protein [Ditylenchus destructor]
MPQSSGTPSKHCLFIAFCKMARTTLEKAQQAYDEGDYAKALSTLKSGGVSCSKRGTATRLDAMKLEAFSYCVANQSPSAGCSSARSSMRSRPSSSTWRSASTRTSRPRRHSGARRPNTEKHALDSDRTRRQAGGHGPSALLAAPGGTIGRSPDNNLVLPDEQRQISRLQATVRYDDDGVAVLRNMSAVLPISVNGRALAHDQESRVADGDRVTIGSYVLEASSAQHAARPISPVRRLRPRCSLIPHSPRRRPTCRRRRWPRRRFRQRQAPSTRCAFFRRLRCLLRLFGEGALPIGDMQPTVAMPSPPRQAAPVQVPPPPAAFAPPSPGTAFVAPLQQPYQQPPAPAPQQPDPWAALAPSAPPKQGSSPAPATSTGTPQSRRSARRAESRFGQGHVGRGTQARRRSAVLLRLRRERALTALRPPSHRAAPHRSAAAGRHAPGGRPAAEQPAGGAGLQPLEPHARSGGAIPSAESSGDACTGAGTSTRRRTAEGDRARAISRRGTACGRSARSGHGGTDASRCTDADADTIARTDRDRSGLIVTGGSPLQGLPRRRRRARSRRPAADGHRGHAAARPHHACLHRRHDRAAVLARHAQARGARRDHDDRGRGEQPVQDPAERPRRADADVRRAHAGFLPPEAAVHDALGDLQSHQLGMVAGMRAALLTLLKRFDPAALSRETPHDGGLGEKLLPGGREARLWRQLQQLHTETTAAVEDDFQAFSCVGERSGNQDAIGYHLDERNGCFVVSDGVGGNAGGELASRIAVDTALNTFVAGPSLAADNIQRCVKAANDAILAKQRELTEQSRMSATFVSLFVDRITNQACWAHVGDSRLYWFRRGALMQRTEDHSLSERSGDAAASQHHGGERLVKTNLLYRALGARATAEATITAPQRLADGDASCFAPTALAADFGSR